MSVVIDGTSGIDTIQDSIVTSAKIVNGTVAAVDLTGNQTGSAPMYGARAWCVFNGATTGTNAPTAGGNVTSVTRNSTGNYTVTLTVALPASSGAAIVTEAATNRFANAIIASTTTVTVLVANNAGSAADGTTVSVVVFN